MLRKSNPPGRLLEHLKMEKDDAQTDKTPSKDYKASCKKAGHADEDGDLPIHIAVVHENLGAVEKLVYMMKVASVSIDHYNNDRQTPLHLAVITKNPPIQALLLQAGSSPNMPDREGCTCIHLAVKHDSGQCLQAILQESKIKPDMNAVNYEGYTALHMSVLQRHVHLMKQLLLLGSDMNMQDKRSGRTALFLAAETNQFSIASLLLQKGANVNIPCYAGTEPVEAAIGRGHSDIVALLIKYGADVSTNVHRGEVTSQSIDKHNQTKSLPDDVADQTNAKAAPTSRTDMDQSNEPAQSVRIIGKAPRKTVSMRTAASSSSLEQPKQTDLKSGVKSVTVATSETKTLSSRAVSQRPSQTIQAKNSTLHNRVSLNLSAATSGLNLTSHPQRHLFSVLRQHDSAPKRPRYGVHARDKLSTDK